MCPSMNENGHKICNEEFETMLLKECAGDLEEQQKLRYFRQAHIENTKGLFTDCLRLLPKKEWRSGNLY